MLRWEQDSQLIKCILHHRRDSYSVFCCVHMFKLVMVVLRKVIKDTSYKGATDELKIDG